MFSRCEICQKGLGNIRLDSPLYCIPCVEQMERSGINSKRYGKQREGDADSAKK